MRPGGRPGGARFLDVRVALFCLGALVWLTGLLLGIEMLTGAAIAISTRPASRAAGKPTANCSRRSPIASASSTAADWASSGSPSAKTIAAAPASGLSP